MQKLNVILAYLLLMVYGVSFGHQVLPHHHHEIDENHNHHSIGVHDHCVDEKEAHNHVAHEDHFDEGVIDFLACILGNHEHTPAGDCELADAPNQQKNTVKNEGTPTDILVENGCVFEYISLDSEIQRSLFFSDFRSSFLAESLSRRGPPMS